MKLFKEQFAGLADVGMELGRRLDRMFGRVFDNSEFIDFTVRQFVDTTSGDQMVNLPDGFDVRIKDYYVVKIDSSVNVVNIVPMTGQTILGLSSYTLSTQYDSITLTCNAGVWYAR